MISHMSSIAQRPPRISRPELLDARAHGARIRRHATDQHAEERASERDV
jgi:hypothetical protein